MRIDWHRQHRWSSLTVSFFLVMFCVSGILLNHRELLRDYEIDRSLLPPFYRYDAWNGGLMRGTVRLSDGERVAIYGSGGIFLTDTTGSTFADYNRGLPLPAHYRNIRAMAVTADSTLYALSTTGLYRQVQPDTAWHSVDVPTAGDETFSDMIACSDSLIVLTRSRVYVSAAPGELFEAITLAPPAGKMPGETLFRRIWDFHSGQMFGAAGILAADLIAITIIFLCVSGIAIWLMKRSKTRRLHRTLRFSLKSHRAIGLWSLIFVALICVSGWCLRPPVLMALVSTETDAPKKSNPWDDRLRMIRYDSHSQSWLLSTSHGFYRLDSLSGIPERMDSQPPVSVMGLTVFEPSGPGVWLCGSFSGAYLWDTMSGTVTDRFSGKPVSPEPGPPFGKIPVAGYTRHLSDTPVIVTYDRGTDIIPMPDHLRTLPMPLWNVALEIHSGRIYFGNPATYFFVFLIGLPVFWCLFSGYRISRR